MSEIDKRLNRFKEKKAELTKIVTDLGDNETDEPRWTFVDAMEEIDRDLADAISEHTRRINVLKRLSDLKH